MNWLCRRGWHKFRPRYHIEPPERPLPSVTTHNLLEYLDKLTRKIYVHDVCTRCGETTQRRDK